MSVYRGPEPCYGMLTRRVLGRWLFVLFGPGDDVHTYCRLEAEDIDCITTPDRCTIFYKKHMFTMSNGNIGEM